MPSVVCQIDKFSLISNRDWHSPGRCSTCGRPCRRRAPAPRCSQCCRQRDRPDLGQAAPVRARVLRQVRRVVDRPGGRLSRPDRPERVLRHRLQPAGRQRLAVCAEGVCQGRSAHRLRPRRWAPGAGGDRQEADRQSDRELSQRRHRSPGSVIAFPERGRSRCNSPSRIEAQAHDFSPPDDCRRDARAANAGERGFVVRRPVPARGLEAIGPFIMPDHMGPVPLAPGEAKMRQPILMPAWRR